MSSNSLRRFASKSQAGDASTAIDTSFEDSWRVARPLPEGVQLIPPRACHRQRPRKVGRKME